MRKLACDPTTDARRPTGNQRDFTFESYHHSEDYDAFPAGIIRRPLQRSPPGMIQTQGNSS
jgi:hypothetical protein